MHKVIHQQQAQTDGEPKADQQHSVTFLHQLSRLSFDLYKQRIRIRHQICDCRMLLIELNLQLFTRAL
ncbi:Uncharacterised protein [Vibrio cholerae]|uniref:Uncharacterized protein n=1 Tax=Vibrio cholerae TaxID=666 RepID=A0A655NZD3_VIBCL|nr:Uncharacterised protein [Vibrio cholerae]CSA62135.1 Uncharacterised protein [Vibrio cholerae]CSC70513.1 Uncharacterised protein [Vibrio cholerae]CSC83944.1 Uncharacterised protein [Vibrio cholerae]CSI29725.1 Uncharacterised protein [Vibrio cholerae]